jgi:hypothetical protein
VPISGRPPSLINPPSGCHFHPRCPYVQDSHKQIDPRLEPVAPGQAHAAACLLEAPVRERIWSGLREGRDIEALQRIAASSNGRAASGAGQEPASAAASSPPPSVGPPEEQT